MHTHWHWLQSPFPALALTAVPFPSTRPVLTCTLYYYRISYNSPTTTQQLTPPPAPLHWRLPTLLPHTSPGPGPPTAATSFPPVKGSLLSRKAKMAWGARPAGIDDILSRVRSNDVRLASLTLMRQRRLNEEARWLLRARFSTLYCAPLNPGCAASPMHACKHTPSTPPPQDLQQLCTALTANTVLRELSLGSHAISPQGAAALATMLHANTTITALCVGNSGFGDAAMAALAPGIGKSSLIQLDAEQKVGNVRMLHRCMYTLMHMLPPCMNAKCTA